MLLLGIAVSPARADDLGGSLLRDYPVALTLPKARLEISLDYLAADENLAAVGLNTGPQGTGELQGGRLLVNYGLQRRTTLMSAFAYRHLGWGVAKLSIFSADVMLHRNLIHHGWGWAPRVSLGAGLRGNWSAGDDEIRAAAESEDGAPATAGGHLRDTTPYARLTAGEIWGRFFPNIFVEYGYSRIDAEFVPAAAGHSGAARQDLARDETYLKAGLSLLVKFPYRALLHLEYDYIELFRGAGLGLIDDNHIFKADLSYYLTPAAALTLGVQYAVHQFNGQVPFLYQEFNQPAFDRSHGSVHIGVSFLFGGKQRP